MDDFEYNDYKFRKIINDLLVGLNFNVKTRFNNNVRKSDQPIIFYGNHINEFDQFIVTSCTNIMIHWITNIDSLDSKLGGVYKLMKSIPNDESVNNLASSYLKVGSSIGIFPEMGINIPSREKIHELYSDLRSGLTYEGYERLLNDTNVKLSQILLLQKLFRDNKISEDIYQKGLLSTELILYECVEKGIITEEEFDDALLLQFNDNFLNNYKGSNATILPFAVTSNALNSSDIVINFGELLEMDDIKDDASNILRGKVLELVKQGERMN